MAGWGAGTPALWWWLVSPSRENAVGRSYVLSLQVEGPRFSICSTGQSENRQWEARPQPVERVLAAKWLSQNVIGATVNGFRCCSPCWLPARLLGQRTAPHSTPDTSLD